ncbi:uncharacterized protein LOC124805133 isoform X3 [Schistocerca piceifrons]|uniref:uncharacterized protein LOC124805133 isoform X3 n=1 Tax=Schistocerca piceifrons TaxID=274613 RepID=UPI001F5E99C0|nr:uncharacterized protein LOC124805133 isoform X3 [Schistocerca piceifrons]
MAARRLLKMSVPESWVYLWIQAQQMTQLLAAINGLVTLQTVATLAPPTPLPVPTAPPLHAFNPDVERWPEYITQLEAHFAAYNIPGVKS